MWILLSLLVIFTGYKILSLKNIWQYNQLIEQPEQLPPKPEANLPTEVLFTKAFHLNQQEEFQKALRLYNQMENNALRYLQEKIHYNMGSIYLQQASQDCNSKSVYEYKQINTMLDLAEQSLRQVVVNNPNHW